MYTMAGDTADISILLAKGQRSHNILQWLLLPEQK